MHFEPFILDLTDVVHVQFASTNRTELAGDHKHRRPVIKCGVCVFGVLVMRPDVKQYLHQNQQHCRCPEEQKQRGDQEEPMACLVIS